MGRAINEGSRGFAHAAILPSVIGFFLGPPLGERRLFLWERRLPARVALSAPTSLVSLDSDRTGGSIMIVKLSIAAGLVAAAIALAPHLASAVPLSQQPGAVPAAAAEHKLMGRCRYWRRACAYRWGWRTPRFFVCMRRHAC